MAGWDRHTANVAMPIATIDGNRDSVRLLGNDQHQFRSRMHVKAPVYILHVFAHRPFTDLQGRRDLLVRHTRLRKQACDFLLPSREVRFRGVTVSGHVRLRCPRRVQRSKVQSGVISASPRPYVPRTKYAILPRSCLFGDFNHNLARFATAAARCATRALGVVQASRRPALRFSSIDT